MLKKYSHKDVVELISKRENIQKKTVYNYWQQGRFLIPQNISDYTSGHIPGRGRGQVRAPGRAPPRRHAAVSPGAAALARLAAAALHGPTQPCRKYPSDMPKYAQNMPKMCPQHGRYGQSSLNFSQNFVPEVVPPSTTIIWWPDGSASPLELMSASHAVLTKPFHAPELNSDASTCPPPDRKILTNQSKRNSTKLNLIFEQIVENSI